MKILPPDLAFALGLAVTAGAEQRSGDPRATPTAADAAGGPVLLVVDEQGGIVEMVEATGIADAIGAIESSTPATGRLLILLVPVAANGCTAPHAPLPML
ncbi:hypothetical protein JJB11_25805 [Ramlibacter ginsenosidimutans]|uniref:Uncharacterized protein n=1 Tax=Ramlibacter ginsenosidimutans TaxID=502333 RepID=A0A934WP23_9BURK|nr:hypothetical protein [Ramlibacter ginsenosidimutans]MBK6009529.1 hypothetical protein [Ramlibacter ginsenosidimutans]